MEKELDKKSINHIEDDDTCDLDPTKNAIVVANA